MKLIIQLKTHQIREYDLPTKQNVSFYNYDTLENFNNLLLTIFKVPLWLNVCRNSYGRYNSTKADKSL